MTQPVTRVTVGDTSDNLSDEDYRDIYDELREKISLDKLVAMLQSEYSKMQWHRYEKGQYPMNRIMRNELRRCVGLPLLSPLTIAEATAQASPDAAVWSVGDGVPEHVIMVSDTPVMLYVNGSVSTVAPKCDVTEVTRARRTRKRYVRPCVPFSHAERLERLEMVSWLDVIEAGLQQYERMENDTPSAQ